MEEKFIGRIKSVSLFAKVPQHNPSGGEAVEVVDLVEMGA